MTCKKKIFVVVPNNVIAFIFLESNALISLQEEFEVSLVFAPDDFGFNKLNIKKKHYDNSFILKPSNIFRYSNSLFGNFFWYVSLYAYLRIIKVPFNTSFKVLRQTIFMRIAYKILSFPPLYSFFKWVDENIIFKKDKLIYKTLKSLKPDLIIYPGSALDTYSHIVARTAQTLGIPTLMIVVHWDFFSKKSLLRFSPNKVYLWGRDMRRMALKNKDLNSDIFKEVGVPQFDRYREHYSFSKNTFRKSFGIPFKSKIILFAGTSVAYDEVAILERLNLTIKKFNIKNVIIIYRPHPRGWNRKSRSTIRPSRMEFVKIDSYKKLAQTSSDHYFHLLNNIDGIISPFSTMVLEAALCGKPCMCISFSDQLNKFDFAQTNDAEHLLTVRNSFWATICDKSEDLESLFLGFISSLDLVKSTKIKAAVKEIVYYDKTPYSERLLKRINKDFFDF